MTMTFLRSSSYLQTAESVTEGHPDKLCDRVADAVLDACLAQECRKYEYCSISPHLL